MKQFKKNAKVSRVATEYGEVLLDEDTGGYWHINETASLVLRSLEEDHDEAHAAQQLVERYGIDPVRASKDVKAVAKKLAELGAL
ncbi:lasso peptide biosynthesis PqqD family chaperone [Brevibacterium luteolum]|uniref:lasso peptide biosynthesis PqqD family chaperone n=1 Tax=Brevibacterium luteolum TaxID=199591 RepID=UPI00223B3938|nr:lasso peptide biosynthesis PqqD family chaperone [Brevibacterium luteolum]MCT1874337.1 lasso peptide biosynthesis PqqD family chaperone [Brevibacterium luteolum]MCT1891549.1 lasso peptide biosynthesis PqqD family chaperone [Brevibacterium luteolum]MCT1893602.1 lasso peptide biosynthesis PqqD family chaperone [Brevibacterium luteolum]MCT1924880.1 lasso peptide biosynthesis PqqD family chaperone [Brevibacterium luteolum]